MSVHSRSPSEPYVLQRVQVATDLGFQFCPYERAGQHAKVKDEVNLHPSNF